MERGTFDKLEKLENCYTCRTDPADVARVESKTFIVTRDMHTTVPCSEAGAKGGMGLWMDLAEMQVKMDERWTGGIQCSLMLLIDSA